MNDTTLTGLASLPTEILEQICSVLPMPPLRALRLVSQRLSDIATAWAFRHVRLGARLGCYDHHHFIWIAQSEKLRPLVREVTCDTWPGPTVGDWASRETSVSCHPSDFLNALPLIRCFRNLKSVHLHFGGYSKHDYIDPKNPYDRDIETDGFRYRVLDTVFHCLAGAWCAKRQVQMDDEWLPYNFEADYQTVSLETENMGPIPIKELTISSLVDYHNKRSQRTDLFTQTLSTSGLRRQIIYITPRNVERCNGTTDKPEEVIDLREEYDIFDGLLTILSLCTRGACGWDPRMDFHALRSRKRLDPNFPHLKFLTLRN
ncbi:hypothetical protein AK830_g3247 [Neonectria ditissima]|uniref:F-box domain-containing protein n=1 Tax=Neonectria ditissima TaxID=78410 RepID=A0A0P7BCH2_9HYPO|nr:hypothetical protein AK830_g3247 [Neonectria ditissima]